MFALEKDLSLLLHHVIVLGCYSGHLLWTVRCCTSLKQKNLNREVGG